MKFREGTLGRVFAVKLEEGDKIPDTIEEFARDRNISEAIVFFLGGYDDGSKVVVGPDLNCPEDIIPLIFDLKGPGEIVGLGTIFPDNNGVPILHMHVVSGREGKATVGCSRAGIKTWLTGEVVILEIKNMGGIRKTIEGKASLKLFELKD